MGAIRIFSKLAQLLDIAFSSPADGDVLTYESSSGLWKNKAASGGGGGMAIGSAVSGGTPGYITFIDGSGNLGQDSGLQVTGSGNGMGILIGAGGEGIRGLYGQIEINNTGGQTIFNGPSGEYGLIATENVGAFEVTTTAAVGSFTVATLPTPTTSYITGHPKFPFAIITDCTSTLAALGVGVDVTSLGGGSNAIPVYWDGSVWRSY